jgi:hypothetical protein
MKIPTLAIGPALGLLFAANACADSTDGRPSRGTG